MRHLSEETLEKATGEKEGCLRLRRDDVDNALASKYELTSFTGEVANKEDEVWRSLKTR